jgi:hypothetical protein
MTPRQITNFCPICEHTAKELDALKAEKTQLGEAYFGHEKLKALLDTAIKRIDAMRATLEELSEEEGYGSATKALQLDDRLRTGGSG